VHVRLSLPYQQYPRVYCTPKNAIAEVRPKRDNWCNAMAEEEHMIKVDFSRAFSPRLVIYAVSLIPGLFFEASVAIGAPETARGVISDVGKVFPFPPYALLICFLASAFVVGHVFMLLAWFAELLLSVAFWTWQFGIRITFGSHTFYRWLATIQQPPARRGLFIRLFFGQFSLRECQENTSVLGL